MKKGYYGTGAIKKAFLAITVFNFINIVLHFVSYYKPIIFTELDYGLYIFKIALYFFVYRFFEKNTDKAFYIVINKLIKATMILDAIELFVSVLNSNAKNIPYLLMLLIFFKFIVDCLLYIELLYISAVERGYIDYESKGISGEKKLIYRLLRINVFILFFLVVAFLARNVILLFVTYILLIFRFFIELKIIKTAMKYNNTFCGPKQTVVDFSFMGKIHDSYREDKFKLNKRIMKICVACAFAIVMMCGIYLYYSFDVEEYNQYLEDKEWFATAEPTEKMHIYHYSISNKMPEWTGLKKDRMGFFNLETRMDSGPKYRTISFNDSGISWDGKEYIDENGKVIIKVSLLARLTTSQRQHILRDYTYNCWDYGNKSDFQNTDNNPSANFKNGVVKFYSDFYDGYGFLGQDGSIVLKPLYDNLYIQANNGLAFFYERSDNQGVVNAKGDILLSDYAAKFHNHKYEDFSIAQEGVVLYTNYQEFIRPENEDFIDLYHIMDQYGNEWEGLYATTDNDAIHKYMGTAYKSDYELLVPGDYTTLLVIDGKIMLESDEYDDFKIREDEHTGEVTEIIGITKTGKEENLSLDIIK